MTDSLAPSTKMIAIPTALVVGGLAVAAAGGALAGCALMSLPVMLGIAATAFGSGRLVHVYATYLSLEQKIIRKLDTFTTTTRSYVVNGRLNLTEALKVARSCSNLEQQKYALRDIEQALFQMGKCLEAASAAPQADDDTASVASDDLSDTISLVSADSSDSRSSSGSSTSRPTEAWELGTSSFTIDLSTSNFAIDSD